MTYEEFRAIRGQLEDYAPGVEIFALGTGDEVTHIGVVTKQIQIVEVSPGVRREDPLPPVSL